MARCWQKLSQQRIQAWIKRLMRYIQEVIRLNEGNEYREGKDDGEIREYEKGRSVGEVRAYQSQARKDQYQNYKKRVFREEDLVNLPDHSEDNLTDISSTNQKEDEQSSSSNHSKKSRDDQSISNDSNIDQHNRSSLQREISRTRAQVPRRRIRQRANMGNRGNRNQGNYLIIFLI